MLDSLVTGIGFMSSDESSNQHILGKSSPFWMFSHISPAISFSGLVSLSMNKLNPICCAERDPYLDVKLMLMDKN